MALQCTILYVQYFGFVIVFFYIFVYMQKNSAQISLNTTNSKNFSHRIYIYLMHHGYVALCASCMQACITPDTRTPFSISCYIIQSFGFIFPFPNRQPTYTIWEYAHEYQMRKSFTYYSYIVRFLAFAYGIKFNIKCLPKRFMF